MLKANIESEEGRSKAEVERLQASIESYKSLLQEAAAFKEQAERQIMNLTNDCKEYQEKISALEKENLGLASAHGTASHELNGKLQELISEYSEQSRVLVLLREEKSRMDVDIQLLKEELSDLKGSNMSLQNEVAKHVSSYKLAVKEHSERVRKMQEVIASKFEDERSLAETQRSEREQFELRIQSLMSTHTSELERYSSDLQSSRQLCASLQGMLDEQSISAANSKAEVALLQSDLSEVAAQVEELEATLVSERERGERERNEMRSQLSSLEGEVLELHGSVETLTLQRVELTSRLETLSKQAEDAAATRGQVEAELERAKTDWSMQREVYAEETSKLQRLLEEREDEAERLKSQAARLEEASVELKARVSVLEDENGGLSSQVQLASEEVLSLTSRNAALESDMHIKSLEYDTGLRELREEVAASQADIERMQAIAEELRARAEKSEREREDLQIQLEAAIQAENATTASLASVREDVNVMSLALTSLLNKHKSIMSDHLADITLSELERKSLQSILDEVHRMSDNSGDLQENMNVVAAYIDMLSRELTTLRDQVKQRVAEDLSEELHAKQLNEMALLHDKTVAELQVTIKELEFELQSSKSKENSIVLELKDITSQYQKAAEELDRTREELSEIQLSYTRMQAEIESSSAYLSREGSVASLRDPMGLSVKSFPSISEAADSTKPAKSTENEKVHLAVPPSQIMLSPAPRTTPQPARSPNKVGRRFRAVDDREESEITLPFRNASVIDLNLAQEVEGKTEDSSSVPSLQHPHKAAGTLNLLSTIIRPRTRMMVMCDMSSTMANGGRIKAQRKCVYALANASIENNSLLALAYWNSKLHWVQSDGEPEPRLWRRGEEILMGFKALESVTPEGGHDMRNALESAIRSLPDATDIVVICHGITWPFEPLAVSASTHIVTNWMAFRRRNPGMKFHFIALGSSADKKGLQRMAKDGDGCFVVIAPPR